MAATASVDVLIVGGGPVGLLIGYQLRRAGCSVRVVEKDDKLAQSQTKQMGRANAIFSRTAELLDQLGLADEITQQANFVRESYTYDRNGERVVPSRVWNFVENIEGSKYDFGIMLRQQFTETCFRDAFASWGGQLSALTELVRFEHRDEAGPDGSHVTAVLKDLTTGTESTVQCKFLVGADGAQSFVRRSLDVPFDGPQNVDKWIRLDGKARKTDMPTPRHYGSIESPTHGNVLWAPLDRGITRIGYVLSSEQEARYGGRITEEIAVKEAIEAVKPFHLEFEYVTWWTLYVIRQRVAATYQPRSHVVLAGDSCHTHSSGAAQGLNTGIHDACNLAWKLALVLKGQARPGLLATYDAERRAAAQRLIAFDRNISALMANKWPEGMQRPANKDINQVLADVFDDAFGNNTGLGIAYEDSPLSKPLTVPCSSVVPGVRVPDVDLFKPGTLRPVRLHEATPNWGCLYVVSFVGDPRITLLAIRPTAAAVEALAGRFARGLVRPITIAAMQNLRLAVDESLGTLPAGPVYYDAHAQAHGTYGVDIRRGATLVFRPDGHVGFAAALSPGGVDEVAAYLGRFLIEKAPVCNL